MGYADCYLKLLSQKEFQFEREIEIRIEAIEKEIEDFEIHESNYGFFEWRDFMSMPWYMKIFFWAVILAGSFVFGIIYEFITRLS